MTDIEVTLNAWERNYVSVLAVQGESDGRTLKATIIDRKGLTDGSFNAVSVDRPIDLTGLTARLYCKKPDGTQTLSDGTVTDATNGKASFVLPQQATAAVGNVSAQIYITEPDNSVLKVIGITIQVQESDIESIESSDQFLSLVEALNKVNTAAAQAAQAAANADKALQDATDAAKKLDAATKSAIEATDGANKAAGTAEQAAKDAASLYQMVDPTTGKVDFVTNIIKNLEAFIFGNAITAQAFDNLNLTAQAFDGKNITAQFFDTSAKTALGVS